MNKLVKISVASTALIASFTPLVAKAQNYDDTASAGGALAGLAIFFILLMIVFWVGMILLWVFWLLMIIDIAKRDWKNDGDRAAYLVLVILLNIVGALIYYFVVKKKLDKSKSVHKK